MSDIKKEGPSEVQFKKEIGLFGGISVIGGIMIGSGIFYLGSYVLQRTNMNMGMALLCWIVGGIVSILGGLCFAELGACDAKAGGMVHYMNKVYHPAVGYSFGFTSWLLSGSGSISALAIALPTAFNVGSSTKIIAIALIVILTAYNCLGVKQANILQSVSMAAKIIPIVIIIVGALIYGKQDVDLSFTSAFENVEGSTFTAAIGMISFATVATLWAYEGWTNLNCIAEEVKNPGKNIPRSLIGGIGVIMIIYTLFNFAIYKVLPHNEIVSMINNDNLYLGTEVAKRVFGKVGGTLVLITMAIAIFGALNGMILAFPRYYYEMARDGHFFKGHGKLSPRTNVPIAALISQAVIAIILVIFNSLNDLTNYVVFAGMLYNALVIYAVLIYRKKFPDMERPYKAWGYPVSCIIAFVLFVALMINTFVEDPKTAIIGLVVPIMGVIVYFIFEAKLKRENKK